MPISVSFKFNLDEKVYYEALDVEGIITTLGFDGNGQSYYIQTASGNGMWVKEIFLTLP